MTKAESCFRIFNPLRLGESGLKPELSTGQALSLPLSQFVRFCQRAVNFTENSDF